MRRDDDAILLDIAHAARLVTKFVAGKDKGVFLADELTPSTSTKSGARPRGMSRRFSRG